MRRSHLPPGVVQERLGHSSVAFTLDRYSHVVAAMQEDAAATVSRLVGLTRSVGLQSVCNAANESAS
jgi:integrase